jgi:5'(3')-deoxyribonucleotidase
MSKIAVDIDDSLYDFGSLAQEMIIRVATETDDKRLRKAAYSTWNEWRTPNDVLEDEWQTIIDMCHRNNVIRSQIPFKNAVTTLRKIFDMGNDIIYISNRSEDAYDATYEWLQAHGFPQAKSLICTTENKAPFIADCQYIIDDRPKTLVEFVYDYNWREEATVARKGFGLFCEYNRALTDVPGIYLAPNWTLLEKYIEEKSDLLGYRTPTSISFSN